MSVPAVLQPEYNELYGFLFFFAQDGHIYLADFKILVCAQTYGGPILDDMGYKAPNDMNHDQADIRLLCCTACLVLCQ